MVDTYQNFWMNKMSLIKLINFNVIGDARGSLVALEQSKDIPFDIKRVYYLYGMQSCVPRGFHAHKDTVQVAVCLNGSCEILMDDGITKETITLNSPSQGLLIDVMQWHEMYNFSENCILMVMANEVYKESDYIRNYDEFLKEIENVNN
uniref:TDP-4-oxo-6-deoxy-alpha-D-glucose-3, 4-oxoisomerase n=7 Tax=Vibrionaceae TaxID=641 RepID=A0A7M1VXR3_VIBPH|nr:TDP-4-oxo-6-deoxy-alpha-D-glucose-3,4-oxoisomerase [Vibrio parahaemolyticus]QOS17223.1 TDP-4-oxo-6-deoxy-alpha-D-glucose-3,4-oxoisomerase [Vibrio parahaemolyticus]QOS18695.1 TDP-4-oxo-6-deoxy-alpha-D-glucose-3,4-oxoisomerase [Vibrio parahaemolyticus]QOS19187.1 TDP-4-oxo-6-deoxy-alpha-D-glucose-3,4-oxoisomerase [Vibrio parahaemolyticus]QOS27032.1 TDP-4-oxo-6-deoxy-alpha-D-glucose-3,4-oxoisomerase [Vibrio parahaemolyticus]